jgi:MFS family permease
MMILASPVRFLRLICLASAGWAFSFGVGTQVVSHWLKAQGQSDAAIGLNHSTYYLGLAVASLFVPWMMRHWGRLCAPVGMVLASATLALFPWTGSPAGWFGMRLLNGAAAAMSLIPLETFISTGSPTQHKARNFGFYAVALTMGGALGIWVGLRFFAQDGSKAFLLGSLAPLAAGLALVLWIPYHQTNAGGVGGVRPRERTALDLQRHFLSYGTGWSQGFLEGGMLAFLSFFLMSTGLSAGAAGGLMGVTMIGVIVFQVPVAWLADRLGRMPVLLTCYGIVLAGLLALPFCGPSPWLTVWLFLFGACSGAFYPLGLALLGEGAAEERLPRLFAWYMAMECFGSQAGAALMGEARDWWGERAMFAVGFAAVAGVLTGWLGLRLIEARRKPSSVPQDAASEPRKAA